MIDSSTDEDEVLTPSCFSLVLASGSTIRQTLLRNSGVAFTVRTQPVDESLYKKEGRQAGDSAASVALRLAAAKAQAVSREAGQRDALIIGADQMLSCEGDWFDKPASSLSARAQLSHLKGKSHFLHSAVVLCRRGEVVWSHVEEPRLEMRDFSDAFLDAYLETEGEACLTSVGAYRLEGPGIQLFSRIEGDYSAILGLPLLPLFAALRSLGMLVG
ncbi:Maf family protein [Acetobacter sp.]|uniref:Maf family protein n=1 Tax=Acetobacter sp. TaxID=440 RepID=UPI0025C583E4|nr:nucleoside triphosphate pyrophosphatase [Acetobacter sp.]MCH4092467.1 Maf family protein [Acetobacter sp.]MCI1299601.1 Maf family protein [Acetobacter sp.]MCI1315519.1 Maf family protein [Acetobacter sp.]